MNHQLKLNSGPLIVQMIGEFPTLLVGEGNLSFTKSLLQDHGILPGILTSTIFEAENSSDADVKRNIAFLRQAGVKFLDNVNATKLDNYFIKNAFRTIIFMFPNCGSREPNWGHNPNHVLVRKFLRSASKVLAPGGQIIVTGVDNSYYDGRYRFEDAADFVGIDDFYSVQFYPSEYPNYKHVNTIDNDSAALKYRKFETWIFKPS